MNAKWMCHRNILKYIIALFIFGVLILTSYQWIIPERRSWFGQIPKAVFTNKDMFVKKFPTKWGRVPKVIKILLWTPYSGDPTWASHSTHAFDDCPLSDCVLTYNKSEIASSDAVIFHGPDLWNKFLGYVLPKFRKPNQTWVLVTQEAPPKFPLNYAYYNHVFNWTASYRSDSDVHIPYFVTRKMEKRKDNVFDVASTKNAGIAWVASNCGDDARRQLLVREIEKYTPVDKYGKCGGGKISFKNLDNLISDHKFYLSFENSICRDYITEKFMFPLLRRTVPIVSGGGDYKSVAPPHSYIDVADFRDAKELADYLNYLDQNDTAYNSYFDWTREYVVVAGHRWCGLCQRLHDRTRPAQVYTDLAGYMNNDVCSGWTLAGYIARNAQGFAMKWGVV